MNFIRLIFWRLFFCVLGFVAVGVISCVLAGIIYGAATLFRNTESYLEITQYIFGVLSIILVALYIILFVSGIIEIKKTRMRTHARWRDLIEGLIDFNLYNEIDKCKTREQVQNLVQAVRKAKNTCKKIKKFN